MNMTNRGRASLKFLNTWVRSLNGDKFIDIRTCKLSGSISLAAVFKLMHNIFIEFQKAVHEHSKDNESHNHVCIVALLGKSKTEKITRAIGVAISSKSPN
jgi:hypothetical protein